MCLTDMFVAFHLLLIQAGKLISKDSFGDRNGNAVMQTALVVHLLVVYMTQICSAIGKAYTLHIQLYTGRNKRNKLDDKNKAEI